MLKFLFSVPADLLNGDAQDIVQLRLALRRLHRQDGEIVLPTARMPIAAVCHLAAQQLRKYPVTVPHLQHLLRTAVAARFQRLEQEEEVPLPDGMHGPHRNGEYAELQHHLEQGMTLERRIAFRAFDVHTDSETQRPWREPLVAISLEVVPVLVREMLPEHHRQLPTGHTGKLAAPECRKSWAAMLGKPLCLDIARLLFGRRHSTFPFIEISHKYSQDCLPIDDLLDVMHSSQVSLFDQLLHDCGLTRTNVIITLGQGRQRNERGWHDGWPERPIFTDWGRYPGPGLAILSFFDDDGENEICMECLVAGFDHAETRMSWGEADHLAPQPPFPPPPLPTTTDRHPPPRQSVINWNAQGGAGHINPEDRTGRLVRDFVSLPQAEVSFNHVMSLVYAFE